MSDDLDPYLVLGVAHDADPEAVTAAYRSLARRHHPDVSPDDHAERRMAEINAAWHILRDPAGRAAYDLAHGIADGFTPGRVANPLRAMHDQASNGGAAMFASGAPPGASARSTAAPGGSATTPAGGPAGHVVNAPGWHRGPAGEGAAGPPPGRPQGSVLPFGRHIGWSLGEVARVDPGYLQWLAARPEGELYQAEIEALLAPLLRRADGRGFMHPRSAAPEPRRGRLRR